MDKEETQVGNILKKFLKKTKKVIDMRGKKSAIITEEGMKARRVWENAGVRGKEGV